MSKCTAFNSAGHMVCIGYWLADFILSWNVNSVESATVSQNQNKEGEVAVGAERKHRGALRELYIVCVKCELAIMPSW